jgi:predicted transcriptional regulator
MLMRSRDRIEIMSQILEAAKNGRSGDDSGSGATKTRLMFNAYLGHGQLKHYLLILADGGLIQYDSLSQTFKTTEKGVRFVKPTGRLTKMIKIPPQ